MRVENLLSPGLLTNGIRVRNEVARAISAIEIAAGRTPGGKTVSAGVLQAFFTDAASRLASFVDNTPPTVQSRTRNSATQVTVAFNDVLDSTVVPPASSVTVSSATVSSVAVSGSNLVITGTGFATGQTVAYTAPAASYLRDRAGNKVANFSGLTA